MLSQKPTQITNREDNAMESGKIKHVEKILKRDRLSQNIRNFYSLFSPASHMKILFKQIGKRETKGRLAKVEGNSKLVRAKLVRAKLVRAKLVRGTNLVRAKRVRAKRVRAKLVRAKLVRSKLEQGPQTGEEWTRLKRHRVRGRRGTNSQGQNQNQNQNQESR